MASRSTQRFKLWFKQTNVSAFFQFAIILLAVIFLILVTSASFYQSMLENVTAFSLQNTAKVLKELDFESDNIIDQIHELELKKSVTIEIYEKSNIFDESFRRPIYRKTSTCSYVGREFLQDHPVPILNFNYNKFTGKDYSYTLRKLGKNTFAGRYLNEESQYDFYTLCTESDDSSTLYVVATQFAVVSAQATAIKTSAIFILFFTFILVAFVAYLFITRITRPLKDIRDVTTAMAETNYTTLRIPTRNTGILTDTDDTIASVNYLYERLILTQEGLREKTEFLAAQLAEKDAEKKSREEFIASTSHELKSPIAIIQGYAEGAKFVMDDPKALGEYCDTIIEECVKMNELVVKMMTLSKLQHTNKVVFSDFSITDFIKERLRLHEKVFEKNGITVENLITENIVGKADKEKLQFVINNLLSNAISYMANEKIIRIRYEDKGSVYRIFVYNSGNQIPQDELHRLWESFYRNDPARSRNEGHFGLGLSIVKSVQDAHSQACGVDNAEGGVEFWFDVMKGEN